MIACTFFWLPHSMRDLREGLHIGGGLGFLFVYLSDFQERLMTCWTFFLFISLRYIRGLWFGGLRVGEFV